MRRKTRRRIKNTLSVALLFGGGFAFGFFQIWGTYHHYASFANSRLSVASAVASRDEQWDARAATIREGLSPFGEMEVRAATGSYYIVRFDEFTIVPMNKFAFAHEKVELARSAR